MKFQAFNIEYDTDGHRIRGLPKTLTFPAQGLNDAIMTGADAISDKTGWCVASFQVRPAKARTGSLSRRGLTYVAVTPDGLLGAYDSLSSARRGFKDCTNVQFYAIGHGRAWLLYSITDGEHDDHGWEPVR